MKVLIFGASGMVGQAVLRECLRDPGVDDVFAIGRRPTGRRDPKLREASVPDLAGAGALDGVLDRTDACFFCLGVSAAGLSESDYTGLTFDLTLRVATAVARSSPGATFIYVSGAGTDASERGRVMWARVKGRTENALRTLPLRAVMFRPGAIVPLNHERSGTRSYRILYATLRPFWPLLRSLFPAWVTTTEHVGRAMLSVARDPAAPPVLETVDINRVGAPRAGVG